jgi:hypothetical protein
VVLVMVVVVVVVRVGPESLPKGISKRPTHQGGLVPTYGAQQDAVTQSVLQHQQLEFLVDGVSQGRINITDVPIPVGAVGCVSMCGGGEVSLSSAPMPTFPPTLLPPPAPFPGLEILLTSDGGSKKKLRTSDKALLAPASAPTAAAGRVVYPFSVCLCPPVHTRNPSHRLTCAC